MTRDEYIEDVKNDIADDLKWKYHRGELDEVDFSDLDNLEVDDFEYYYDDMELYLTGNADGSHYCNSYKAKEALGDIIWDEDVQQELHDEFCYDAGTLLKDGPEAFDVVIRCLVFNEAWQQAVEEFIENLQEKECDE